MSEGGDIVIRLRLFGFGDRPGRFRYQTLTLPEGATVRDLLARWREEACAVPPDNLLIIVNGQNARDMQGNLTPLSDGDEVTLMLPVAGGALTPSPCEAPRSRGSPAVAGEKGDGGVS